MANLSAYIAFNASLQKGPSGSSLVLTDPDNYPMGVNTSLLGYFVITQPDGITITGSFGTPDVSWNGSILTPATKELRLAYNGNFQQGIYQIDYHVVAAGYDETLLSKSFTLSYSSPTIVFDPNLDFFTPVLSVTDDSDYAQSPFTLVSVTRAWEGRITSVEGTPQTITGSLVTFLLAYLGVYYDARFAVTLISTVTYQMTGDDDWITIIDIVEAEVTYDSEIPPTLIELLELLTDLKTQIDDAGCICGTGCCSTCSPLLDRYKLAVSIYTHIVERGREGVTIDLGPYVVQLQKLLNNCVTPTYTHTNEAIPAYDWGGGGGTSNFAFYKQMIVGSGINGAPADGATNYVDAALIGRTIMLFLDGLELGTSLTDRQSYVFDNTTGTITWFTEIWAPSLIRIYTL